MSQEVRPIGERLPRHVATEDAVTCEEASRVRGTPLNMELKTLIVFAQDSLLAVSVLGSKRLSLRRLKHYLGVEQASLASKEQLDHLGIEPGTVCPLLDPVWSLRNIFDPEVFLNDYLVTNAGSLREYFIFDPKALTELPNFQVAKVAQ
jgi:prolyl-tRNA editing enzyme YbaK/EbsC (Cys-tRNA(Pro) deacylase)